MENTFNLKNFNQTKQRRDTVPVITQSPQSGDWERGKAEHSPSLHSVVHIKKIKLPRYQPTETMLKQLKTNAYVNNQGFQKLGRALKQENTTTKDGQWITAWATQEKTETILLATPVQTP